MLSADSLLLGQWRRGKPFTAPVDWLVIFRAFHLPAAHRNHAVEPIIQHDQQRCPPVLLSLAVGSCATGMKDAGHGSKSLAASPAGPDAELQSGAGNRPAAAERPLSAVQTATARSGVTAHELHGLPDARQHANGDMQALAEPQHRKVVERPLVHAVSGRHGGAGSIATEVSVSDSSLPRCTGPALDDGDDTRQPEDLTPATSPMNPDAALGAKADHVLPSDGQSQQRARALTAQQSVVHNGVSPPAASDNGNHRQGSVASLGSGQFTADERAALAALDDEPSSPPPRLNGLPSLASVSLKSPSLHEVSMNSVRGRSASPLDL